MISNSIKRLSPSISFLTKHFTTTTTTATTAQTNWDIKSIGKNIDKIIEDPRSSRLFAIVQIAGSQYKITTEDLILIRNPFYPTVGDKIRLEKVLMVGGNDISIIGKPIVRYHKKMNIFRRKKEQN
jgi:hypothetical protein